AGRAGEADARRARVEGDAHAGLAVPDDRAVRPEPDQVALYLIARRVGALDRDAVAVPGDHVAGALRGPPDGVAGRAVHPDAAKHVGADLHGARRVQPDDTAHHHARAGGRGAAPTRELDAVGDEVVDDEPAHGAPAAAQQEPAL